MEYLEYSLYECTYQPHLLWNILYKTPTCPSLCPHLFVRLPFKRPGNDSLRQTTLGRFYCKWQSIVNTSKTLLPTIYCRIHQPLHWTPCDYIHLGPLLLSFITSPAPLLTNEIVRTCSSFNLSYPIVRCNVNILDAHTHTHTHTTTDLFLVLLLIKN